MLLISVLYVSKEMVLRLGAVTRVGYARLIFERFRKFWGAFSFGDLLILNTLASIIEFVGVLLTLGFLDYPKTSAIPAAVVLLSAMLACCSFRPWKQVMFMLIAVECRYRPAGVAGVSRPGPKPAYTDVVILLGDPGSLTSAVLLVIMEIVGTTVTPWQLFFQQSNVADKRIMPCWMRYGSSRSGSFVPSASWCRVTTLMSVIVFELVRTAATDHFTDAGARSISSCTITSETR